MKTIIQSEKNKNTIFINTLKNNFDSSYQYICYITSSNKNSSSLIGTGVAICTKLSDNNWGFIHHRDLLIGPEFNPSASFSRITWIDTIEAALQAHKEVFFIEKYSELLDLCKQYQKY